jgi:hypothetical protein
LNGGVQVAKMTKAQARKRLDEARRKVDAVAMSDVARHLPSQHRNELYALANRLIMIAKKIQ